MAISQETSVAFTEELHGHTLAYTILADGEGVGTGTVVSIGEHVLVATTRHTLPAYLKSKGKDGEIGLIAKDRIVTGDRSRWLIRHESDTYHDLGLFEISHDAIHELNLQPIGIDRLHDACNGHPLCKVRVIGYPKEYRKDHFPQQGMRGFRAFSYGTEILDLEAWNSLYVENLYSNEHVVLNYDQNDNIDWLGDHVVESPAPHPGGMSGGGIWQAVSPLDDKHIWTVDRLRLIAVQCGWYAKYSVLKGTQVIYWLKLVTETYRHLRDELEATFPRLKTLS